jgi:serine/threonine protein kinase
VVTHLNLNADEVLHESGVGTFGKVFLCRDKRLGRTVAVKVVRSIPRYTEAAKIEADILEDVNRADPAGVSLCVRFFQAFDYCGHYCMVFEALGPSLFDFISANKYRPAPLYCVQSWGDQLLTAIAFLHEMRLIHTDLKLENVLLVSREPFTKTDKLTSARTKHSTVLAPARTDIKREIFPARS